MFSVFSLAALHVTQKQFCLHFENYRSGKRNGRKAGTVEPRFNDLRYNDIPYGYNNDQQSFAGPTKVTVSVKCMGHKPGITIFPV